ncbi:hypothetical protein LCGC14_0739670 [marine sediment metagenome]|uniref:BPL/LPL catalytic domain-containing protein n=1 Tax=marine sediment metagenome TaxID=412755 RepID=A0A0F9Q742_9ZZZZ|nr:biotin--[acetyl-CoA-carboxylase] ligase [bacterium]
MFSKIKIVHIDKTRSTQDTVIDYLQNDYFSSLLLVAKIQTGGRGRKDDDWHSPLGGFWATLGISTSYFLENSQLALFHYFTALLITRVIKEEYNFTPQIKWPNDILFSNKKLGGILIDYITGSQKNYLLIGMGINLNNSNKDMPENLKSITISIKDILSKTISLEDFARKICFYTDDYFTPIVEFNTEKITSLIEEYNQYSRIYGKQVVLDDSKHYLCKGINLKGLMTFEGSEKNLKLRIDDLTRVKEIITD